MLHLGSGCIYEGDNNGKGFSEEDAPNFFGSFYSRTKIMAQDLLKEFEALQIRIRMPIDYLPSQRNLLDKISGYKKVISVNNSITVIEDFLKITDQLIEGQHSGIFNVVNKGQITHAEILGMYQEISGRKLDYELISTSELDTMTRARRSNCILSTSKLERLGIEVPDVRTSLRKCLEKYCIEEARLKNANL